MPQERKRVIIVGYHEKIGKTWPTLYYFGDFVPDPTGNIDWEEMGFKVVSELNINYPYNDADSFEEAEKLVKIIAKKFNCVVYYPSSEDYFISEDFKQV